MNIGRTTSLWNGLALGCAAFLLACGAVPGGDLSGGVTQGTSDPGVGMPATPDSPKPKPGDGCSNTTLGDPMTCLDAATWKGAATMYCASKGEDLGGLALSGPCGKGQFRKADVQCCPKGAPPPPMCVADKLGDGKTCMDPGTLKMQASEACAKRMLVLTDLKPLAPCMGGFTAAEYTCCAPAPPPPPPPPPGTKCFGGTIGDDGTACYDNGSWEVQTTQMCKAAGMRLAHLSLANACGPGEYGLADYECCP